MKMIMEETKARGDVGATQRATVTRHHFPFIRSKHECLPGRPPCINIWGKYTVYHFSSHLNCIMISMQTQVSRGQGTKLSGSWKQLHRFLSLTMLGWLSYQKPLVHAS